MCFNFAPRAFQFITVVYLAYGGDRAHIDIAYAGNDGRSGGADVRGVDSERRGRAFV